MHKPVHVLDYRSYANFPTRTPSVSTGVSQQSLLAVCLLPGQKRCRVASLCNCAPSPIHDNVLGCRISELFLGLPSHCSACLNGYGHRPSHLNIGQQRLECNCFNTRVRNANELVRRLYSKHELDVQVDFLDAVAVTNSVRKRSTISHPIRQRGSGQISAKRACRVYDIRGIHSGLLELHSSPDLMDAGLAGALHYCTQTHD